MENLKTYENFLKKSWKKLINPMDDKYLNAGFLQDEKIKLEKLGFTITVEHGKSVANFELQSIDTIIIIQSFFVEDYFTPGSARRIYKLSMNSITKEYKDFESLLVFLKDTISYERHLDFFSNVENFFVDVAEHFKLKMILLDGKYPEIWDFDHVVFSVEIPDHQIRHQYIYIYDVSNFNRLEIKLIDLKNYMFFEIKKHINDIQIQDENILPVQYDYSNVKFSLKDFLMYKDVNKYNL